MREVKLALLEADVNFLVVKKFVNVVSQKALGEQVMQSLTPGQQVIKIVHEEMTALLGQTNEKLVISPKPPSVYLMCGLQGAGKTTFCGKLAHMLKGQGKRVLLAACDVYRPAAIQQLGVVAKTAGVEMYTESTPKPVLIAANAVKHAEKNGFDIVIIDSAGRLAIDEALMRELTDIKREVNPTEILLTVDAMIGQDAVNTAKAFDEKLNLTGVILTKLDGDARGGAALSIREVTGKPIKFCGTGEKIGDIEAFHPERIASRILGMGDILTVIEKAKSMASEDDLKRMERKMRESSFTLEDFLLQYESFKKMGNMNEIVESLGGAFGPNVKMDGKIDESQIARNKAIIQSMTPFERRNPDEIKAARKRRIASGSGTTIQEINSLLKQFEQSKLMMRQLTSMAGRRRFSG
jgi:signal recognition particle subunit SRP54